VSAQVSWPAGIIGRTEANSSNLANSATDVNCCVVFFTV
jgi:hypothetical protein